MTVLAYSYSVGSVGLNLYKMVFIHKPLSLQQG